MFEIKAARERAITGLSFVQSVNREIEAAYHQMHMDLHRQMYGGREFIIPILRRPMPQKRCTESLFGRMHDWEITYSPAKPCWNCEGRLEVGTDEGTIESCGWCTYGWIPEGWLYKCRRCEVSVSKT